MEPSASAAADARDALRTQLEGALLGWLMRGEYGAATHAQSARELAEEFLAPHDRIAAAIFAANDTDADLTPAAIALRLAADQGLKELGGRDYLVKLVHGAPALVSDDDARRQIDRTVAEYASLIGKMALEARAQEALTALQTGSPDALERFSDLSRDADALASSRSIIAKPFQYRAPEEIPPRRWLFGRHAIRGFISATAASGGTGKTALAIAECLALVTGRNFLQDQPLTRASAWYLGLEDPLEEYERRITAAMLLHHIRPNDLGGLFLNSGRAGEFVIAGEDRNGLFINRPAVLAIRKTIAANNIALLTVDPFVACHTISESDNTNVAAVAREWAAIADETGCAVELIHHVRKGGTGNGQDASADDARGASALVNATRSTRLLVTMSPQDAERGGIDTDSRRRFFRVANVKANLTLHADDGVWREMQSITLRNGGGGSDDLVGAVKSWAMPDAVDMADPVERALILDKLRGGGEGGWRLDPQSSAWAGHAFAEVLDLDMADKGAKATVKRAIDSWLRQGLLTIERRPDAKRRPRQCVVPVVAA